MVLLICITAVVALISLYDYFSTRTWNQVTSSLRNDIVFEKRNRAYGAYRIRRDYNRRVLLILFGFTAGIGGLYAASLGFRGEEQEAIANFEGGGIVIPLPDAPKQEIVEPEMPETPSSPPAQTTTAFIDPVPVDTDVQGPAQVVDPTQTAGAVTQTGNDPFAGTYPNPNPGTGTGTTQTVIDIPVETPVIDIDEPAEYIGGREAMVAFLEKNFRYPGRAIEENIQGKVYTQFIVSKEGDISEVKVQRGIAGCSECDKEALRVINKMPRWKPGKKSGRAVMSYFNLPIYFKLAN